MVLDDYRHIALVEAPSTNTECFNLARQGDPGRVWVTAQEQTSGRGRRGRAWTSKPGNLYASLLLINPAPADAMASLPLAVAVAVQRAISAVLPPGSAPAMIKWPNDILINRQKVCGILIEGERIAERHAIVIGCGINVVHAPDHGLYPVTSLRDHGSTVFADQLFPHLFKETANVLAIWDEGRGLSSIIEMWTASAGGIGEKITVNLPRQSISGHFRGIDDNGHLILDTGLGQTQLIAAGDVFFG